MNKKTNEKKKKKIRFKGLLIVILFVYLVLSCVYYLWTRPIKYVNIEGNVYLKESYISDYLSLEDTSIMKINKKDVVEKLILHPLISDASVKKVGNKLNIVITEEKILFYNLNKQKLVLSNGEECDNESILGIPSLINYVPLDIYTEFIEKLTVVDHEVLSIISEIEYNPSIVNGKTVDEKRFLLRMNDGNTVYINTINIEKINNYLSIIEAVLNKSDIKKGCLYLDSISTNNHFDDCKTDMKESDIVGSEN